MAMSWLSTSLSRRSSASFSVLIWPISLSARAVVSVSVRYVRCDRCVAPPPRADSAPLRADARSRADSAPLRADARPRADSAPLRADARPRADSAPLRADARPRADCSRPERADPSAALLLLLAEYGTASGSPMLRPVAMLERPV
eukprot:CAMPEP_0118862944 /NCGR_PEP_ID=MMETSP1163-20130328/7980_1 /TAXON_ID=124430 /ORGANISM="Phaeomonas parva, Strain CCMP2877" /LENGTH=144 /DNA_ID=CAMNT_0006796905 /DNA_START=52 /DNA_END=486 /DNA_ORIENTATION=-